METRNPLILNSIFEGRFINIIDIMEQFNAHTYYSIAKMLGNLQAQLSVKSETTLASVKLEPSGDGRTIADLCREIDCEFTAQLIDRVIEEFRDNDALTAGVAKSRLEAISERLQDELRHKIFMRIFPQNTKYLTSTNPFGKVHLVFPKATFDIKHASISMGTGEYTSAVFHLMRVVEVGLLKLCKDIGISIPKQNPNWMDIVHAYHAHFKAIHGVGDDAWKKKEPYYSSLLASFTSVKDAWRNKIMHIDEIGVDNFYEYDTASAIYEAVKNFMVKLCEPYQSMKS